MIHRSFAGAALAMTLGCAAASVPDPEPGTTASRSSTAPAADDWRVVIASPTTDAVLTRWDREIEITGHAMSFGQTGRIGQVDLVFVMDTSKSLRSTTQRIFEHPARSTS